jgi:hypothetical protein
VKHPLNIRKRTLKKGSALITPNLFMPLKKADRQALRRAADQYGKFLGLPVEVTYP